MDPFSEKTYLLSGTLGPLGPSVLRRSYETSLRAHPLPNQRAQGETYSLRGSPHFEINAVWGRRWCIISSSESSSGSTL